MAAMPRRGIPNAPSDWYLREWMQARGLKQAEMARRAGWSKATMSQLYNGVQDYSPRVCRSAADALNLEIYELFLPPIEAPAIRQLRQAVRALATSPQIN